MTAPEKIPTNVVEAAREFMLEFRILSALSSVDRESGADEELAEFQWERSTNASVRLEEALGLRASSEAVD